MSLLDRCASELGYKILENTILHCFGFPSRTDCLMTYWKNDNDPPAFTVNFSLVMFTYKITQQNTYVLYMKRQAIFRNH